MKTESYANVEYPEYLTERRLPKHGPDRVRFCVWYEHALDEGKSDEEARDHAFGCLQLMYFYVLGGLADKLSTEGGVPIEFLGEDP